MVEGQKSCGRTWRRVASPTDRAKMQRAGNDVPQFLTLPTKRRQDVRVSENLHGVGPVLYRVHEDLKALVQKFGMVPLAPMDEQSAVDDGLRELEHEMIRVVVRDLDLHRSDRVIGSARVIRKYSV